MTDPDLEHLAELWRDSEDVDQADLEAMARKARRQGRMLAYADLALFLLIAIGTLFAFVLEPAPATRGIAVALLLSTIYVMWKRRTIRQMSPLLSTSNRRAFLADSVKLAAANVRRITFSLHLLPLGIALAAMFKIAMRSGGHIERPFERLAAWTASPRGVITLSIGVGFLLWTYRSLRRARAELARMREMEEAYEAETARDREDAASH